MPNHLQGSGYFPAPSKLQSKEEVIARVCALIEKDLSNKDRNKDTRTPEEIERAKDEYWHRKIAERYAIKLRSDNFKASFLPPIPPVYGPVKPRLTEWRERDFYGRYGHVRSD